MPWYIIIPLAAFFGPPTIGMTFIWWREYKRRKKQSLAEWQQQAAHFNPSWPEDYES